MRLWRRSPREPPRPGSPLAGVASAALFPQFAPAARRFAVLINPFTYGRAEIEKQNFEGVLGVQVIVLEARGPDDFDAAFATMARERVDPSPCSPTPVLGAPRAARCVVHQASTAVGSGAVPAGWKP